MKRISVSRLFAGILLLALLTGCSDSSSNKNGAKTDGEGSVQKSLEEAISVTVMCGYAGEDPHGAVVYQYADAFMEANPSVKIEVQAVSTNDIYTKLAAMAVTPDDLPTMFFASADTIAALYDLGLTADIGTFLTQEDKDEFVNGVADACTLSGQMAYYPVAIQPQAIIYRKDHFEEAGLKIPTTWDEFIACAKALTSHKDKDGAGDEWGFSMVGANNSSGQSRFLSYLWSNGYELVYQDSDSEEWKTDITNDPAFINVFSKWTDMDAQGIVPTGITEVDYPTAANYFAMGYTNMFLTGPNALGIAYAGNPDLKGKLASFKLPGDYPGSMLGVEGYALSSHASEAEQRAAVDYLKFFVSHDKEMKFWQASGKIVPTLDGQTAGYLAGEDYAGFLQQIKDGCRPTLEFAGSNGLKSALGNAYSAVFSEEKTNAQAVESLVKSMEELLEEYQKAK